MICGEVHWSNGLLYVTSGEFFFLIQGQTVTSTAIKILTNKVVETHIGTCVEHQMYDDWLLIKTQKLFIEIYY